MNEKININGYFDRIGFTGSIAPTLQTLEALTALHPASIPFETLSPLLGKPVLLDQKSLERKMLTERRGGYCFEHNLMLMRVLADLDFSVRPLGARSLWGLDPDSVEPISHMLLAVDISGSSYIADVGFGGPTPTGPLRLRDGVEQKTPHERYRLIDIGGEWRLEIRLGPEDWRAMYRFTLEELAEEDYQAINTQVSSAPDAPFTRMLAAAIAPKGARHTLADTELSHYTEDGISKETLNSVEALKTALTDVFGIALPEDEALDATLERVISGSAAPETSVAQG
ncbi:N-hydroxyarylamine O-acetyltransferase [Devosia pacifica]|uniref:N-hydroxyarylamine O-acetyltransferase n=1 Tax=Devosia pacifica TaxID=1335967 RepID=A0A918S6G9_9HYPH|nr:arylamine N-acetyltransferase [Devosia pacifica]GHA22874.1 N-hydroxyarylamine O-acetyltransferase [Devosia pacifica]